MLSIPIHLLSKYVLKTYYVLSNILNTKEKRPKKVLAFMEQMYNGLAPLWSTLSSGYLASN